MTSLSPSFDVEIMFAQVISGEKKRTETQRGRNSPLYRNIYPMVYVIKVFGLAPYNFVDDRLVPASIYFVFTLIFALIYCYVMYMVYVRFTGLKRERPIQGSTETLKVIFNFFVAMYNMVETILTRKKFAKVWNAVQDYDETVRHFGYHHRETTTAVNAWILFVLNIVLWATINQSGMIAFNEKWAFNAGYMTIYVGTCVAIYKFVGIVVILGQRFHHLNEIVRSNALRTSTSTKLFPSPNLKMIVNIHDDLMTIGEDLAGQYSWSLLLWLANLSIHSVSNVYFVIDWMIFTPWRSTTWRLIFCLSTWITAFISQIFLLCVACDYAAREANAFPSKMIEWEAVLNKRCKYVPFRAEMWLQMLNRRLSFSAGGCFNVNLPLLRSIAALLSTYLVILMQLPT